MPVLNGTKTNYDKTNRNELVAYCQARGLDVTGTKHAMAERIEQRDAELRSNRYKRARWTELAAIRNWYGIPKWHSKAEDIAAILCDGAEVRLRPPLQYTYTPRPPHNHDNFGKGGHGKGSHGKGHNKNPNSQARQENDILDLLALEPGHFERFEHKYAPPAPLPMPDANGGQDNDAEQAQIMFGEDEETRVMRGLDKSLRIKRKLVQSAWCQGPTLAHNPHAAIRNARDSLHLFDENVVYASDNGGPLGNNENSFIAITTTSFFRVHDNKLYTRVALEDIVGVDIRRGSFLREDKIVFTLKNGEQDTAGIAIDMSAAIDEYITILRCVVTAE